MIWIYRLLFPFALIGMAPRYLWRMRRRGGYRKGFLGRLGGQAGLPRKRDGVPRVWLQAVSVGEMLAIDPILRELRALGAEIHLTTTTSTGFRVASDRYRPLVAGLGYFPLDWWPFSARAWRRIDPDLSILMEGERWPEHMRQAGRRGVPVLCANARISDRSFRRMKRFPAATSLMLGGMSRVLAGSVQDEERFLELGFPADRIQGTGNIKLDVAIPLLGEAARCSLRRELGLPEGGHILLGSSTWPGEEEALVKALLLARAKGRICSLLLVPRHAERRAEIDRLLGEAGLRRHLRSRGAAPAEVDVAVGDTTGELGMLTQLADLVFIGKSLPPHGEGQTPVEAAVLGKPILLGPGMGNFREIARNLLARGAARLVGGPDELAAAVEELLGDEARRAALAAAAAGWRRENAGAMDRTLRAIRDELDKLHLKRPESQPVPSTST